MSTLEVGCGDDPDPRATLRTDVRSTPAADEVADVLALPYDDDAFDAAIAHHVIEHVQEPARALANLARVVVPGGTIEVAVPVGTNACEDPTHQRTAWSPTTLRRFADGRGWDETLPIEVIAIETNVWLFGPLRPLSPLFERLADRWTDWGARRAGGGEIVARYEVSR